MSDKNSNYKGFLLRQLGIKESQFPSSGVNPDVFPGIDPNDTEPFKKKSPPDEKQFSPSAKSPPIIGVAVRGSVTGGLPSGKEMTLGKMGGYAPIPAATDNSVIVDKTPQNSGIDSKEPISKQDDTQTDGGDEHPYQIQKDAGEPPQCLTGAEVDGEANGTDSLNLKAAVPQEIDVDVGEDDENSNEVPTTDDGEEKDTDTTNDALEAEDKSLQEGKHKAGCKCGFCANKGKFGKKSKETGEDKKEDEPDKKENPFKKKKVSNNKLEEIIKSLEPKAIAGKMNLQESKVFSAIKEVLKKRQNKSNGNLVLSGGTVVSPAVVSENKTLKNKLDASRRTKFQGGTSKQDPS